MKPSKKLVDLDALLRDAGEVVLNGQRHAVRPIDGATYHLIQGAQGDPEGIAKLYRAAGLLLPSVTEDRVMALTVEQVTAVINLASGQVDEVATAAASEASDPNAQGPASASPSALPRAIQSAT